MKRTTLILSIAFLSASLFHSTTSKAQNQQGKSVVTVGAGSSLASLLFAFLKTVNNQSAGYAYTLTSTPVIIGAYDYAVADKFSIGAAFSYQTFAVGYTQYTYTNSQNIAITGDFTDRLTRINVGLRPLVHFGDDEHLDNYFGARISYTNWSYSTTNPDPYYDFTGNYSSTVKPIKVQVLYGIRYFFTDLIGINGEIAIGPSYYIMGGLNFKF